MNRKGPCGNAVQMQKEVSSTVLVAETNTKWIYFLNDTTF
jgi:hypothetical protein